MLWPIRWNGSPGNAASISAASTRARRFTPEIAGTSVSRTRLPAARRTSGMPRKYEVSVNRP